jgi:hypothetical protein
MMKKQLYIHLGFPKTGTTTLQKRLFPHHSDYLYLGKLETNEPVASSPDEWLLQLRRDLVSKEIPFFKQNRFSDRIPDRFHENYEKYRKVFLSDESILGRCINPGKYGRMMRLGSPYSVLQKLQLLTGGGQFETVKLILVIRNQADFLESFFAEEYPNFKTYLQIKNPNEFVDIIFSEFEDQEIDSLLHLSTFISFVDQLFGRDNVLVLPYERMEEFPVEFMMDISEFMSIQPWNISHLLGEHRDNRRTVNTSKKGGKLARTQPLVHRLSSLKNRMFGQVGTGLGKKLSFLNRLAPDKIVRLDEAHRTRVMKHYAIDNELLIHRVDHVSEYGSYF